MRLHGMEYGHFLKIARVVAWRLRYLFQEWDSGQNAAFDMMNVVADAPRWAKYQKINKIDDN